MSDLTADVVGIFQIIWIDLVLSGDNAVVIALACRGLPPERRRLGIALGAGVAVGLRILFAVAVTALLETPFLKIVGALALFWIAIKVAADEDEDETEIRASDRLWVAVRTIAIADAVMSLDNVLAIAAVARGSIALLVFGLLVSIPLIMAGATLISALLDRFPLLLWAGAALLGWVAGEMLVSDPWLVGHFGEQTIAKVTLPAAIIGGVFVVLCGVAVRRRRKAVDRGTQPGSLP